MTDTKSIPQEKFICYWGVIPENLAGYGSRPRVWITSEEQEKEVYPTINSSKEVQNGK